MVWNTRQTTSLCVTLLFSVILRNTRSGTHTQCALPRGIGAVCCCEANGTKRRLWFHGSGHFAVVSHPVATMTLGTF